jgi:tellurite resistance protein TerC
MEINMAIWWIIFILFILAMLALDLGVFNRRAHVIKVKEALWWTFIGVLLAMLFCLGIYYFKGQEKALEFLAAYLIEESLSIDNLFVFLLIFNYFGIPTMYEHKVLFWGIGIACDFHHRRSGPHSKIPLGHLHLRRFPDYYGN